MRFQAPSLVVILIACGLLLTAAGQQPQSVVLRPGAGSSSNPNIPQVHVSVDQQRVPLGTLVNFILSPATLVNDRRYVVTLHFGDGRRQVMQKAETTHLYQTVGTYTYSVAVTQAPNKPNDKVPSVGLTASPENARARELVKFTALPSGPYPNLQYRFVYGDGSASAWQSAANSEHLYQRAGNYFAYVDIGDSRQRLGGSARKQIAISSPRPLTVSLTATQPARIGRPVTFNARTFPTSANAKYQFNFGDGQQTLWQVNSLAQHVYKTGGSYNAYVQVSQSDNTANASARSNVAVVSVQPISGASPNPSPQPTPDTSASPTPTPESSPSPGESPSPNSSPSVVGSAIPGSGGVSQSSSSPTSNDAANRNNGANLNHAANRNNGGLTSIKWWYWLFAGVLLLLLFKATGYLFVAKPTFTAFSDPGVAKIGNAKGLLPLDFQLLLNPNVSAGDYSVTSETPLVTNSEKLENRQMLEI